MHSEQPRAVLSRTSWRLYSWLAAGALAALLIVTGGCRRSASESPTTSEQAIPKVTVVKPEKKAIRREVAQPGHIEAYERTPIMARIPGYVLKWNVDIGDIVEKNEVLAVLSVPDVEANSSAIMGPVTARSCSRGALIYVSTSGR